MPGFWRRLFQAFARKKNRRSLRRVSPLRRWLRHETLEIRATMDASITGIVFTDANDDGIRQPAEALLGNVTVQLFRDGGDGQFNNGGGDDVLVDTDVTPGTGVNQGRYTLNATQTGTHFVVQQTSVAGQVQRATQRVRTINVPTITAAQVVSIDNFNSTTNLFTADTAGTNPEDATTTGLNNSETLGTVRDLHATANAGALTVAVNLAGSGVLDYGNTFGGQGIYLATYDGDATNAPNLLGNGLGAGINDFDMTAGGIATFMRILLRAETNAGDATLTIRGRDNNSVEVLANALIIPEGASGDPLQAVDVNFSSFPAGFDPTQVGALQFEVTNQAGQQVVIDNIGLFADPVINTGTDLVNLDAMTIGNLVFLDRNNDGIFNGADTGISGVTLQLYRDTNNNSVLDPAEVTAQPTPATTTTNGSGIYNFTGLIPGSYIVLIPQSEFGTGQELAGHLSSPGAGPADTNNRDQGAVSGTLGVAAAVVLVAAAEPTDDGDGNNGNLTVDFGFTNTVLALTKTDNPDPVQTGGQLTYTLTATNNGPSNATNVVISDPLPTGLSNVTATYTVNGGAPLAATITGGTVTTGTFNLSASQQAVLTIIATVGTTFVNNTSNTGSVVSTEVTTPVTATTTTARVPDIDLGITKTISAGATVVGTENRVGLGGALTYRLTVTNNSPTTTVTGIRVTDDLPPNFTPGTLPAGVTLNAATADPNDLVWNIATLAPSASATVDIPVTVATTAALGATLNTAIIDVSPTGLVGFNDTNPNNNSANVSVTVEPRYELRVTKTNNLTALTTGQTFTYTIQAINDGPSSASNVTISDTLPASLEFISASTGSATGQVFTANVGTLAAGATSTPVNVTVRVRSSATGANIANTATVAADNPTQETNTGNNSATDTDPLTRTVTLNVSKDDSTDPVAVGASFVYTVTAFNSGNADTTNAVFTDVLPTGIEFVSGTFTINETTPRTGTVTFDTATRTATANLGTLLPGSATTNRALITLNVRAAANATPGTVTNVARLTSTDNTTGVTDSETTVIVGVADLSGRVYIDLNRNGVFDAGEAGIPNVTININGTATGGGAITRSTTTDANGQYIFEDLPVGVYTVQQVQPPNFTSSATNVGTIGGTPSGTGTENRIATINLTGDSIANNFGELRLLSKRLFLSSTT